MGQVWSLAINKCFGSACLFSFFFLLTGRFLRFDRHMSYQISIFSGVTHPLNPRTQHKADCQVLIPSHLLLVEIPLLRRSNVPFLFLQGTGLVPSRLPDS